MRTEKEILDLILGFASEREDVRAVVMSGSRANPTVKRDRFQDYDITYVVEDVAPYRNDARVPAYFGEMMILQKPHDMGEPNVASSSYAYLMQFKDANRIDLTFRALDDVGEILADSLSVVLLDKDGTFALPPPSLKSYLPERPTAKQFADCCNEYWWLNPYVAKGLYRDQIPYAKSILDGLMRGQLLDLLIWHVGVATDFQVTVGDRGKYLKNHLEGGLWELMERSYSDARRENIWASLYAMNELFRIVGRQVARAFGFTYPEQEDAAVSVFVRETSITEPREKPE